MRRALVPLLLAWAILATVLSIWALLRETPPAGRREADVAEVERMRRRIATLERVRDEAPEPTDDRADDPADEPVDAPAGSRPTLPADVPGLLETYRRARDEGDVVLRNRALERLEALGETSDEAARRAWLELLREAKDAEEAQDLVWAAPAGREADLQEGLLALLRSPDPWRRAAAAEALLDVGRPGLDLVRRVLTILEEETDASVRSVLVLALGPASWGLKLTDDERSDLVAAMRAEVRAGGAGAANSLAHWSDDPVDLAVVSDQIGRETDPEKLVLWLCAYRGGVALTKGREAECREALRRFLADPAADVRVRKRALQLLQSLKPWDPATEATVREHASTLDR